MKYVLDASVAIKWVLPEVDTDKALALRDEFLHGIHELIAPDTFSVEVAHALTRAERKGAILLGEAQSCFTDVVAATPALQSFLPLLPRALELSSQMRCGVYDCLYVALAESEQCPFVTSDERLVKSLPGYPLILISAL